jgi:hypothetical protein
MLHRKKFSASLTRRLSARSPSTVPRGLRSSSDMIAGISSPLSHRSYFPWSRGSLSIASPWNPRVKKVRPRISPRPYPIGTGYIRLCLQLLHCVTLIAAVNECPLPQDGQCSIVRPRRDETTPRGPAGRMCCRAGSHEIGTPSVTLRRFFIICLSRFSASRHRSERWPPRLPWCSQYPLAGLDVSWDMACDGMRRDLSQGIEFDVS